MASTTQTTSPLLIVLPTSTNIGLSGEGFLYKVPIIGDLIVMYLELSSTAVSTGAAAAGAAGAAATGAAC